MSQESIQTIPLDQLHASGINVRKTGEMPFADLVASIAIHGLLQNLLVAKGEAMGNGGAGGYLVVAGGRRLRAIRELEKSGKLPDSLQEGVPCKVVPRAGAHEVSLVENVVRAAMHPADEFDAFAKLANEGAGCTVGEIAARFGKSELYVRQRLKLANVDSELLQIYRTGKMDLEQVMALALTDDHEVQKRVWKQAKHEWQRNPDSLREAITQQELAIDSTLGKFVGIEAYERAGGIVRRDLFAEEGEAYLTDTALVQRIAAEKLERTVEKIKKEGWLWVEARPSFDYSDERAFGRAESSWKGSKQTWTDEQKATAGAIVTVSHNGQAEVKRGFVRPEDRKAAAKAGASVAGGREPKKAKKPGEMSFAAVQRLQAEAGNIVAGELQNKPSIALALLAAELALRIFYNDSGNFRTWIHIHREASGRMPGNIAQISGRASSSKRMEAVYKDWQAKLPKKRSEARAWILAQDRGVVDKLLAYLIARELDVVDIFQQRSGSEAAELAAAAQVKLGDHWKPSDEWLASLPKAVILAMATEAGAGKIALAQLAKAPKAKLPQLALSVFPEGWVPKPLRAPPVAKASKGSVKKVARKRAGAEAVA
ncbi:ParB/RepB/Spo0J family partition protein [Dyella sp. 2RAB6]|uniref:ParB/RepB/Spo0J family partition protein n=1 Tax=Dyella sp. 2RAB6 TaxID=3232992 RepID=UPI003F8DB751